MGHRYIAVLLLLMAFIVFAVTDSAFTFLEDETAIVTAARAPAEETIGLFLTGNGQHEHPPLSDLLLHYWLPVANRSALALRIPSIVFYLGGLFLLGVSVGVRAELAVVTIGVLWPFGFHFGRLCGWYSLTFFLLAALTVAYERLLAGGRIGWFVACGVLLSYCNYYGWVVVVCLLADCARRRHARWRILSVATIGFMTIAYLP